MNRDSPSENRAGVVSSKGVVKKRGDNSVFFGGEAPRVSSSFPASMPATKENMANSSMKDLLYTTGAGFRSSGARQSVSGGGGKHVSSYTAATVLLRTLSERCKIFDKGAVLSKEMQDHVQSIAEAEDARKCRAFIPNLQEATSLESEEMDRGSEGYGLKGRRTDRNTLKNGISQKGSGEACVVRPSTTREEKEWAATPMRARSDLSNCDHESGEVVEADLTEKLEEEDGHASFSVSENFGSFTGASDRANREETLLVPGSEISTKRKMKGGGQKNEQISVNQRTDAEIIELQVSQKQERLDVLRSFQRAIVDVEDRFDEERAGREALQAAGHNATSEEYEEKMKARGECMKKAMRENFELLFDDAEDLYAPPEPSSAFSIENMTQTLGALGKSLATLVEATDEICTTATFKTEGDPVSIFLCTKALRLFTSYAKTLLEQAMLHLLHFESGERGILEGAVEEVNRQRETFLLCKDQLVVEEQNLKVAVEHRQSLIKRLRGTHERCDMWEKVLFHRDFFPNPLEVLEGMLCGLDGVRIPTTPQCVESGYRIGSPAESVMRSASHASNFFPENFYSPAVERNDHERESNRRISKEVEPLSRIGRSVEDAYEAHVAQVWGNPYVHKAKQYEKACASAAIAHRLSLLPPPFPSTSVSSQKSYSHSLIALPAGLSVSALDITKSPQTSVLGHSFPLGKNANDKAGSSSENSESDDEIMQTMLTRQLQLLQGLLRTIPATIFSTDPSGEGKNLVERSLQSLRNNFSRSGNEKDTKVVESTDNSSSTSVLCGEKFPAKNTTDVSKQTRVEVRQSIQRLIRYTSQELKKYSAPRVV